MSEKKKTRPNADSYKVAAPSINGTFKNTRPLNNTIIDYWCKRNLCILNDKLLIRKLILTDPSIFGEAVKEWMECGFQTNTHAIRDRGYEQAITKIYVEVAENTEKKNLNKGIE